MDKKQNETLITIFILSVIAVVIGVIVVLAVIVNKTGATYIPMALTLIPFAWIWNPDGDSPKINWVVVVFVFALIIVCSVLYVAFGGAY